MLEDKVRVVQRWLEFPWMTSVEYDAYLLYQHSQDLSVVIFGIVFVVLPLLAFRCDLGNVFSYNHYQFGVILCGLVASGCSILHMTLVHKSLTLKKPLKSGILANVVMIASTLSTGLHLLGRVHNGACPPDATLLSSQGCIPHGRIPSENVLILYLVPFVCLLIVRGVSFAVELGSLCLCMFFTAVALETTGELNPTSLVSSTASFP